MLLSEKRLKYNNNTVCCKNVRKKLVITGRLYTENIILLEILSVALRETDCHPTSETLEWLYILREKFTFLINALLCFSIHRVLFLLFLGLFTTASDT